MKLVFQAIISSIVIHIIYLVSLITIGYIKARNYKLDILNSYDHVEILQDEVVFGKITSPFLFLITFVGVAIICGILIFSFKKSLN